MSVKPISVPTKRLSAPITTTATSFTVNNITGWDGVNLTAAQFGTLAYVVFRNSTNTLMEIVEIDATTIAAAGITITKRGLNFTGGITPVTANQLAWPANDTLVDFGSDPAQLLTQGFIDMATNQTIPSGVVKTFITSPIVPTPLGSTAAANKAYVDGVAISGAPDSSTTVKGILEVSVAPVSPTTPIAVGDNDPRVSTQGENNAQVGNNTDIAVGTGNKFITQTGLQHAAENYAASTTGNDTYVVTLSPVPTSYTAGMTVRFKPDTANTGAATINVNGLGAKSILRNDASALVDGDIAANAVVTVSYDGTQFLIQSPYSSVPKYAVGGTSYNIATASGNQTIAHGLGRTPRYIRVTFLRTAAGVGTAPYSGVVVYNGTTQTAFSWDYINGAARFNSSAIQVFGTVNETEYASLGSISFDGTNITLPWTKTGSPTGTVNQIWEAFA